MECKTKWEYLIFFKRKTDVEEYYEERDKKRTGKNTQAE